MKLTKTLLASTIAAASFVAAPTFAEVEVSGSVAVASTYLWRGADLGSGTPAVSGDLSISASGFYTGIWGSSGDTTFGSEYDLYVGYGGESGSFSYDFSLWSYNYPTGDQEVDLSDVTDFVVAFGFGPVAFTAYVPVGDENSSGDYMYYTLGASFGQYAVTLGMHASNAVDGGAVSCPADAVGDCDPVHINFDYAFNDNLTFTFSQFIADETADDDLKFVVSYSLPIGG